MKIRFEVAHLQSPTTTSAAALCAIVFSVFAAYIISADFNLFVVCIATVIGPCLLIWGVRSRTWFPLILIFVLGFEQFTLAHNSKVLTFSKVGGVLLVAVYFFLRQSEKPRLITSIRHIPLQFAAQLLLVLWFAVTSLWSTRTDAALVALSTFVFLLGLTWIVADFIWTPREIAWFTNSIIVYGLMLAALTVWQYQDNLDTVLRGSTSFRSEGINDNPNIAAQYMVLALGVLLGRVTVQANLQSSLFNGAGVTALVLGIGATASRGGAVATIILCFVTVAFLLYHYGIWRSLHFVLLTTIIGVAAYFVFPDYWIVLGRRFSGQGANITGERSELAALALRYFLDNPIFGIGFQSFRYYNSALTTHPPHNTYTGILAETGLVGISIFACVLVVALWNAWSAIQLTRKYKQLHLDIAAPTGLLLGLVGFCAAIVFGDNVHNKFFWLILALIQMASLAVQQPFATSFNSDFYGSIRKNSQLSSSSS